MSDGLQEDEDNNGYLELQGNHYENMPMQYTEIFKVVKNENFQ